MKDVILKYYKEILLVLFGLVIVFLLYKIFKPSEDKSELLKYKLDQIDSKVNDLKNQQKSLSDTIILYKNEIKKIDENLSVIRNRKTTINNFYDKKSEELNNKNNKELDSLFRLRYGY